MIIYETMSPKELATMGTHRFYSIMENYGGALLKR